MEFVKVGLAMINSLSMFSNLYSQKKQAFVKQRYDELYAHELAHKSAAGTYGGAIVIEKDSNGIPVGGHVSIQMPTLDKKNPDKTIKHTDTVIRAAMAPTDPSSQDYKVAAEARAIRSQALAMKNDSRVGKKLDYQA
jgi:hypothetical protein